MVDILRMGSNNLLSLQQAMSTTGHNISNVNTEGFSRQTVHFESSSPQRYGSGFIGSGSQISSISRSYNDYLTTQVQSFTASQSRYEAFVGFSTRVDDILANSENSLNTSIQKFFSATADVAANPSTLAERQVLIGEANNLVDRQRSFSNLLENLNQEINAELSTGVTEINGLADSIAKLNQSIGAALSTSTGSPPNDMLDERDRLVKQLSEIVAVTVDQQDGKTLNVYIGKGQALVVGDQSNHLKTQANPYDSSRLEVAVDGQLNVNGVSQFISGGKMQGLLDFRSKVLIPAQTKLGLIALGITEKVNAQHTIGMDLDGSMGGNFFTPGTVPIAGNTGNGGTSVPSGTLTDVSQVRPSDYRLAFDGAQWELTRLSDGTSVTGAGPLALDGMSIDVTTGTPNTGDSFIINPGRSAAANFGLAISDPRKIAAASPVISETTLANAGAGAISDVTVAAINTLPLAGSITLTFNPDALGAGVPGFDVTGGPGGTIAYDPATENAGKTFNFATEGLTFTLSDVPQTGDSFVINSNAGATGDNRNILKIGEFQYQATLNGGKDTFQEFYGSMVAQVAVDHRQANSNLTVETSLLQQATAYRDNASGVNLDEEAANLLRYQQAYQASAQLIKIADELFTTLINSLG